MDRIKKQNYKFNMLNIIQGMTKYTEIDEIMNCLAAYEDTGLTPEEISILKIKSESALDPIEMAKIAIALRERDALKKALELMATYLVHFGRLDEMLCDDIPQPLHLKYQPKMMEIMKTSRVSSACKNITFSKRRSRRGRNDKA